MQRSNSPYQYNQTQRDLDRHSRQVMAELHLAGSLDAQVQLKLHEAISEQEQPPTDDVSIAVLDALDLAQRAGMVSALDIEVAERSLMCGKAGPLESLFAAEDDWQVDGMTDVSIIRIR